MLKYYTAIVTYGTHSFDEETTVRAFEDYNLFKTYAVNIASNPDVSKQQLLKTALGRVPKVTELKLSFKDNLVVLKEDLNA